MPELEIVHLPTGAIEPNPWNPNRQNSDVSRAERESIERFGFVDPVTVRQLEEGRWQIIDGEHRWREAGPLGMETVPAVILDVTEQEARKLTVVLNEVRGDADVVLLGQLLNQLRDEEDFATALPYTPNELEHLLALSAEDWDSFTANLNSPAATEDTEHVILIKLSEADYERVLKQIETVREGWSLDGAGNPAILLEALARAASEIKPRRSRKAAA